MGKIVLLILLSCTLCQSRPSREGRQFGWLWGNSDAKQAEQKQVPKPRPSQGFQRRTNQFVNEVQGNGIGNYQKYPPQPVLNRKYPPPPSSGQNKKGLRRPVQPPPKRTQQRVEPKPIEKRKLLMPIIISSYASTNIQGRGNDNQKRIQEALDKYEKLNEISYEIKSDDVKEADITELKENYDERVQAKVVELADDQEDAEEILILGVEEKEDNDDILVLGVEEKEDNEDILILGVEEKEDNEDILILGVEEKKDNEDILVLGVEKKIEDKDILVLGVEETRENIKDFTTIKSFTITELAPTPTTTQVEIEESSTELITDSPFSNEISEIPEYDGGSPYLPEIPEKLDEEIHGTPADKVQLIVKENIPENYLAGYQQVEPAQTKKGSDRTEQQNLDQNIPDRTVQIPQGPKKPDFYPLGGKPTLRPPFKKAQQQRLPAETQENSFFDFLPFWKSSEPAKPKRPPPPPRRPVGPTVTKLDQKLQPDYPKGLQAPLLLKVGSPQPKVPTQRIPDSDLASQYPTQETPERSGTVDEPSENERIDNSIFTELVSKTQDAFIVLPVKKQTPQRQSQNPARSNARPPQRLNAPPVRRPPPPQRYQQRPPHPRVKNTAPLPMLSQPVIGLPQVPASRKQSPFIAKRPPLPPQLPASYPGALNSPLKKNYWQKPQLTRNPINKPIRPINVPFTKKPNKKIFKKPESFPPKVIENQPKQSAPLKVQDAKPFDFTPNGSKKPASDIASHLSSLLNSFFSTTVSPARPAPSLPSLVEDTEFADIVNGYKSSDEEVKEIQKTALSNTLLKSPQSTRSPPAIQSEESPFDDLDSLSAPSLESKYQPKKKQFLKLKPTTTTVLPTTQSTTTPEPTTTSASTTTTTTTESTTRLPITSTTPAFVPRVEATTTFISPIQELVNEYQKKGHVIPQNHYPEPVLKAIQKNFEHKKNIFEQFVSFEESDKRFIPNKEVYNAEWSKVTPIQSRVNPVNPVNLSEKVLVYQTFAPPETTSLAPSTLPPQASTGQYEVTKNYPTFPHERNSEGGFRPMLRPLHQPLLN